MNALWLYFSWYSNSTKSSVIKTPQNIYIKCQKCRQRKKPPLKYNLPNWKSTLRSNEIGASVRGNQMPNAVLELQNIGHRTFATKTAHSQLRCNTQNCNVHIIKININVATGFFFASGRMHTFPVLFSSEVCAVRGFFSFVPPCIFSLSFSPYLNISMAFTHLHNIGHI